MPTSEALAEAALAGDQEAWANELFQTIAVKSDVPALRAKGLSGLAWSQFKAGQLTEAADSFDKLLKECPQDPLAPEAALVRGQILERKQQFEPALEMYRCVIERYAGSPQLPIALLGAARVQDELRQFEAALALYQRLIDDYPQLPQRDLVIYNAAWRCASWDATTTSIENSPCCTASIAPAAFGPTPPTAWLTPPAERQSSQGSKARRGVDPGQAGRAAAEPCAVSRSPDQGGRRKMARSAAAAGPPGA